MENKKCSKPPTSNFHWPDQIHPAPWASLLCRGTDRGRSSKASASRPRWGRKERFFFRDNNTPVTGLYFAIMFGYLNSENQTVNEK